MSAYGSSAARKPPGRSRSGCGPSSQCVLITARQGCDGADGVRTSSRTSITQRNLCPFPCRRRANKVLHLQPVVGDHHVRCPCLTKLNVAALSDYQRLKIIQRFAKLRDSNVTSFGKDFRFTLKPSTRSALEDEWSYNPPPDTQ